jgi:hypothetical protein
MSSSKYLDRRYVSALACVFVAGGTMCCNENEDCFGSSAATDPSEAPLNCGLADRYFYMSGEAADSEVELSLGWCGCTDSLCYQRGDAYELASTVDPHFGTLVSEEYSCPGPKVKIRPAPGITEGDVYLSGKLAGRDEQCDALTCTFNLRFHVIIEGEEVRVENRGYAPQ